MKLTEKVKQAFSYAKKLNRSFLAKTRYLSYVKKLPVNQHIILLEAQHGEQNGGNIYYILKELTANPLYKSFSIYYSVDKNEKRRIKRFFKDNGIIQKVNLTTVYTKKYFKLVASAKYLVNDTTFLPFFIKKEGQVYLNTWHGTPLKTLGKKVKNDLHNIGNVQKNFIVSDYLLYPNEFTMKHITEDYMLENICKASMLLCGYPRNTAFYDEEKKARIIKEYSLEDKQVFVYMPTWRGRVGKADDLTQNLFIMYTLAKIDRALKDDQIMYVKLHIFTRNKIDFNLFKRVKPFPEKYEAYEFLNIADCLITDYSSVFFDFAVTGKKVILYTYDEQEYLKTRGLYISLDDLPFPKTRTDEELITEMNKSKDYDDSGFINKFCKYDGPDSCKRLCEKFILGTPGGIPELKLKNNGKENVLIYAGNLAKNGITVSLKNLLNNIDLDKRNYYITFNKNKVKFANKDEILNLPQKVKYIATMGKMNMSLKQNLLYRLYRIDIVKLKRLFKHLDNALGYEIKRRYGNLKFDHVIHFNGYEYRSILYYSKFDCNRVIYVHNDMEAEIKLKGNQHKKTLDYAYTHYDKIAVVTEDMAKTTGKFGGEFGSPAKRLRVVNNILDYKGILEKSKKEIILDDNTKINMPFERAKELLNDADIKKFINIGRFSKEKGHIRLIDCFNRLFQENKDICLVIIGGYGGEYGAVVKHAQGMECADRIIIINSISNPYPILNRCNYFVLSSFHEGFGLVLAEADILGKPVISTDIDGPGSFMREHGGVLVENSEQGIYKGMKMLLEGKVKTMKVDYEKYNRNAAEQFEGLF